MSEAQVHDAVALKILELPSVAVVYGDGSTDARVKPWPEKVVTMPAALVKGGAGERTMGLSRELWVRQWTVDFYLPLVKGGATSVRLVNTLLDEIRVEFRDGVGLGGLVSKVRFTGNDDPIDREEGEGEALIRYLVLPAHFVTEQRVGVAITV